MGQCNFILGIALMVSVDLTCIQARSVNTAGSFVVSAEDNKIRRKRSVESTMTQMNVKSVVKSRFAKVTTTTIMENSARKDKELTFSVRLPEAAFISKFTMNVDGITFIGKVKEKALAKREYEGAVATGNSAGLVTAKVRETQTFNVAANVPAQASVTFELEYQELLKRKLGKYEQVLFINPGQVVDDLSLNVYITEEIGISTLQTRHPQNGEMKDRRLVPSGYESDGQVDIDVQIRRSRHQASVRFKLNQVQQRRLLMIPENDRKVSVIYDVTRENLGGELLMRDGYFVHFFAPEHLPALPKKVVFVIDQSGSMSGVKMKQTKTAFETVLRELSHADEFNIVSFASGTTVWESSGMVPVNKISVQKAVRYVNRISAYGRTNFNEALLKAVDVLGTSERRSDVLTTIIALTDGAPTVGVTSEKDIRNNVKARINGSLTLFCIGFGHDLNHDFLKKLSNDNNGIARKIYADSDADLQMEGFFKEVATPLLLNINIRYIGMGIKGVSKSKVDRYFKGSEIVVVGTKRGRTTVKAQVTGTKKYGKVEYSAIGREIEKDFSHSEKDTGAFSNFIERLWAYYTIDGLLDSTVLTDTKAKQDIIAAKVTRLALKYSFVTPLTSMVVVSPVSEAATTTGYSTAPPAPVCLLRFNPARATSGIPLIWCPYIFDGSTPNKAAAPRRQSPPVRQSAPARSFFSERIYTMFRSPTRHDPEAEFRYRPPIIVVTEESSSCGGVLKSSEDTINLPWLELADSSMFHCDWKIYLPRGSWIDLYLDRIQTTTTKIVVTSGSQVIFRHDGGHYGPKYFLITANRLKIRMFGDPMATHTEDVTITYKEFVVTKSTEPTGDPYERLLAKATCGRVISVEGIGQGTISSPNYPSAYPPNTFCKWKFVVDTNTTLLSLRFVEMDIETNEHEDCAYDRVTVDQSSVSKSVCGMKSDLSVHVDPNSTNVIVTFRSDNAIEGIGFQMQYEYTKRVTPKMCKKRNSPIFYRIYKSCKAMLSQP